MNDPSVTETTVWRAASKLAAGDRIAAGFLQPDREAAEVLFTYAYPLSANGDPFVLVNYRADDRDPDAEHFLADSRIPLEAFTNAAGYGYSREADDPTPVSPARVRPHTGGVVDGGQLVDETESGDTEPACAACGGTVRVIDNSLVHVNEHGKRLLVESHEAWVGI